jgi:hypothetical protein
MATTRVVGPTAGSVHALGDLLKRDATLGLPPDMPVVAVPPAAGGHPLPATASSTYSIDPIAETGITVSRSQSLGGGVRPPKRSPTNVGR